MSTEEKADINTLSLGGLQPVLVDGEPKPAIKLGNAEKNNVEKPQNGAVVEKFQAPIFSVGYDCNVNEWFDIATKWGFKKSHQVIISTCTCLLLCMCAICHHVGPLSLQPCRA